MKTSDLIEQRGAIVARMNAAHAADDNGAFTAAETELQAVDAKLTRAKKIDALERSEPGTPINGDGKLDHEIRSRFSLARLVASTFDPGVDAGFEREIQGELAKRAGRPAEGLYVPTEIFETRVLTTTAGAELVETDQRADLFINALAAATAVRGLGATVLSGLTGNVSIPRETASPTAAWVAENAAITSTDPDFDQVTLSPKHVGALSEWSRNMVLQSSPAIEGLLRQMLARNLAIAIDTAAIKGGGSNEPTGVLATSGIATQAYATSLFATAAEMVAKADIANVGTSRRSFLTTNTVGKIARKALTTDKLPVGIDSIFQKQPVTFSNLVPETLGAGSEHGFIYGDWSELLIGLWSELDLLVNPYSATPYSKGNVQIRAMATMDLAVRHPLSFVSGTGVTTSAVGIA